MSGATWFLIYYQRCNRVCQGKRHCTRLLLLSNNLLLLSTRGTFAFFTILNCLNILFFEIELLTASLFSNASRTAGFQLNVELFSISPILAIEVIIDEVMLVIAAL